jgi:hypothetical protein
MEIRRLSEEDVQKFLQGCEDLMRLGVRFTENIRQAIDDLRKTYEPALKSQYVDKAIVDLLTRSLREFEQKVEPNLDGIEKMCSKGGNWFAYYLGRTVEKDLANRDGMNATSEEAKPPESDEQQSTKKPGSSDGW